MGAKTPDYFFSNFGADEGAQGIGGGAGGIAASVS